VPDQLAAATMTTATGHTDNCNEEDETENGDEFRLKTDDAMPQTMGGAGPASATTSEGQKRRGGEKRHTGWILRKLNYASTH
jgi:hypothetical protein